MRGYVGHDNSVTRGAWKEEPRRNESAVGREALPCLGLGLSRSSDI